MDEQIVQRYLNSASEAMKAEWTVLVRLAIELPTVPDDKPNHDLHEAAVALSFASRAGTDSIKRKLLAIQHARATGLSPEEIMAQGQEVTVSAFNRSKRDNQLDEMVWLKWKVPGLTRELVMGEYERICEVLNFNTAQMFFSWLLAQLIHLTPEELKHSAGEAAPPPSKAKGHLGPGGASGKGKSQGKSGPGKGKPGKSPAEQDKEAQSGGFEGYGDQGDAGADVRDDDPE